MRNSVCLVGGNEISRVGLAHILSTEAFNVVHSSAGCADIPDSYIESEFLIVVDEPHASEQAIAVERLRTRFQRARIVVLANRFDLATMVSCFRVGTDGYIVNAKRSLTLLTALRLVALGEKVMPSDLVEVLGDCQFSDTSAPSPEDEVAKSNLSPRERDVLYCLMAGFPNKIIARNLGICEATIKVHVKAILRKLKVNNRTQAAIWASQYGTSDKATSASRLPPVPSEHRELAIH